MIRLAPAAGLLLASPVVFDALRGRREVDDALLAWLLAMVLSAVGLWFLQQTLVVTSSTENTGEEPAEPEANGRNSRSPLVGENSAPDGRSRRRRGDE